MDRLTTPLLNNRLVFSALIFGGTTSSSAREMSCSREVEALKAKARSQPRQMTDDEWRLILTPEEYHVTRMKGTERPFSCARVNDNHQKQLAEANAAAKAMRLTGCVGCMALGHAYEIYFRSCDATCPFCHKEFKKNESRHFATKCNKMPSTRQECIQVLRNNQKRR